MAERKFTSQSAEVQALRDRAEYYHALAREAEEPWFRAALLQIALGYNEAAEDVQFGSGSRHER